jgi:excisionase family DNA binding protein
MQDDIILTSISKKELSGLILDYVFAAFESYTDKRSVELPKANLTKREAANELSCGVAMIDKLVRSGRLEKIKVGAKVLIPRTSIDRILSNKKN